MTIVFRDSNPFGLDIQDIIDLNAQVVNTFGDPLENAHITVSQNQNTTTDQNGYFQLNDVPYNATVTVTWQNDGKQIEAFRIGNKIVLEVESLDEVVITNEPKKNYKGLYIGLAVATLVAIVVAVSNKNQEPRQISM